MIVLDNTDVLEGGASVNAVIDYSFCGMIGSTLTQLAAGVMDTTLTTVLYTAGDIVVVTSIILVNKHTSAVNVTLALDPANSGNPRYILPKTISLGAGYSLHTDGVKTIVLNASGALMTTGGVDTSGTPIANDIARFINADTIEGRSYTELLASLSGQFGAPFDFADQNLTNVGTIALDGGQIAFPVTAVPSADPNTLDDYEEGEWTPSVGGDATYTKQLGTYIVFGQVVAVFVKLVIDVIGTGSATQVSGFPFTARASPAINSSLSVSYFTDLALSTIYVVGLMIASGAVTNWYTMASAGIAMTGPASIFGNNTRIDFSGIYPR